MILAIFTKYMSFYSKLYSWKNEEIILKSWNMDIFIIYLYIELIIKHEKDFLKRFDGDDDEQPDIPIFSWNIYFQK